MALPFALRARIQWRDEPRPARRFRAPKLAGPVLAYWSAMAALAYGVSTHALPLDDWFWPPPPVTETDDTVRDVLPPPRVTPFPARPRTATPPVAAVPAVPLIAANAPEPAAVPEPDSTTPAPAPAAAVPMAMRLRLVAPGTPLPSYDSDGDGDGAGTDSAGANAGDPATTKTTALPARTGARLASRALDDRERPTTWHGSEWAEPSSPFAPGPRGKNVRGLNLTTGSSRRDLRDDSGKWLYLDHDVDDGTPSSRTAVTARSTLTPLHPDDAPPAAAPAPEQTRTPASVGSCEAAIAGANDVIDMTASGRTARAAPDVTRDAYASLLDNGRYLSSCRIPAGVGFEICAAIKNGRAVGVTVMTRPRDAAVSACVRRAVTRLSFPASPRLDVTRTRFDAVR